MTLLLIDGNSIINRAYYGIRLLTTSDGKYSNAIYGFLNVLIGLTDAYKPDAVAVAWDLKAKTFRHKMYPQYKAGRHEMPQELFSQLQPVKDLVSAMGIKNVSLETYEADDVIGTLSRLPGIDRVYICTGDRDSFQLVSDTVTVLLSATKAGKPSHVEVTPEFIMNEYGVSPIQMTYVKALQGDSSDNIPGVPGIGPKTALELIGKYGTLDSVYEAVDKGEDIRPALLQKLSDGKDSAYLSYDLGLIDTDVPLGLTASDLSLSNGDPDTLKSLLSEYELNRIASRMGVLLEEKVIPSVEKHERPTDLKLSEGDDSGVSSFDTGEKIFISFSDDFVALCAGDTIRYYKHEFLNDIIRLIDNNEVVAYDSKPLYHAAAKHGVEIPLVSFDVKLAAYLLDPGISDFSPDPLLSAFNVVKPNVDADESQDELSEAQIRIISEAAGASALYRELRSRLEMNDQMNLLNDIELPLAKVLANMECRGFRIDKESISVFAAELKERISALSDEIFFMAGEKFNINSLKQLGDVLFEKLGIKSDKKNKSGYSTSAEVLEKLAPDHPIVSSVLEYRTLSKLLSTYCEGLLKAADDDGKVRSTFNQTETRTGRISSSEPNLQNIPVRTPLGAQMRKFFIADDGCVLVDADYSQIELRVLADLSCDENMIRAFNDGEDIHTITASQIFSVPTELVNPAMRRRAKAVNFGIVYGIGAFSLAKNVNSSVREAKRYIDAYLEHYKGVDEYMKSVIDIAKKNGYCSTLFNRRRYLPELSSKQPAVKAFGERVARNMPIQGTAADIIKIAMIRVEHRLLTEGLKGRLIMQVHDELIISCPEDESEYCSRILMEEMSGAVKMKVPLTVDVNVGKTWYDAKG